MSDRLERETHIGSQATPLCGPESVAINAEIARSELLDLESDSAGGLAPEIQALIQRCIDGTEPIDRPLKYYQTEKFTTRHVNIVMLSAAGFKGIEIADAVGCTDAVVSNTINHPYGRKLRAALMGSRGVRILDIRTKLDAYAGEVLDQLFEMTSKSSDLAEVAKVGFGLLDRAGYGATQKVQHSVPTSGVASESTLSRLSSALEESTSVDVHIVPAYVPKPPPDEGREAAAVSSSDSRGSGPGSGAELSSGGVRLARVANS